MEEREINAKCKLQLDRINFIKSYINLQFPDFISGGDQV